MNDINTTAEDTQALSAGKALLMLGAIIVFVGLFIALNFWVGIEDFWAGFLFILYWSTIEQMKEDRLPHCIVGAIVGLLAAYALQTLPQILGPYGLLIPMVAILVMIYCQLMGWVPVAVNTATMLFLTVATIPVLQAQGNFVSIFSGLGLGVAFFVTLMAGGSRLAAKFSKA
jgi:hypothetical protein